MELIILIILAILGAPLFHKVLVMYDFASDEEDDDFMPEEDDEGEGA